MINVFCHKFDEPFPLLSLSVYLLFGKCDLFLHFTCVLSFPFALHTCRMSTFITPRLPPLINHIRNEPPAPPPPFSTCLSPAAGFLGQTERDHLTNVPSIVNQQTLLGG